MMGWGWGWDMPGWGGHWMGGVFMLVFWVLVILGVAFLVRSLSSRGGAGGTAQEESPLEILKRRYARGEIDKVEFEEKKKALTG